MLRGNRLTGFVVMKPIFTRPAIENLAGELRPAILPGAGDTFIKAETGKYSDCQHAPDNRQAAKTG